MTNALLNDINRDKMSFQAEEDWIDHDLSILEDINLLPKGIRRTLSREDWRLILNHPENEETSLLSSDFLERFEDFLPQILGQSDIGLLFCRHNSFGSLEANTPRTEFHLSDREEESQQFEGKSPEGNTCLEFLATEPAKALIDLQRLPVFKQPEKKATVFCKCSKTKCLKLYCNCFSQGSACNASCVCLDCRNTGNDQDLVQRFRQRSELRKGKKTDGKSYCRCVMTSCTNSHCPCFKSGGRCLADCTCYNCSNKN